VILGCISSVDKQEAREVGMHAVRFAMAGDVDGSVAIKRVGEYSVEYGLIDLSVVAGQTKIMSEDFFENDNMVNETFVKYIKPLVGNLDDVVYLDAPLVNI